MQPKHLLDGIETFGEDFPKRVPFLIEELAEELGIDMNQLDKSEKSIRLLDISLYSNKEKIDEEFVRLNLMRIEAYLGEVFIRKYGGNWDVKYDSRFNIYVPFVTGQTHLNI